jgi:tetratricopeptide (TPR) repeat protein
VGIVGALGANLLFQILFQRDTLAHPERWLISQLINYAYNLSHVGFVVVLVVLVAAFALGWWVDAHPPAEGEVAELPLARDLRSVSFKLGDDVAAGGPYILEPVRESFEHAMTALREASTRAAEGKSGILVMGVANAGKTRLALEVVRKTLADWRVLIWRPDDREPHLAAVANAQIVVFIDDLQEHAPTEVRDARGSVQALDTRAIALKKMLQVVREAASQVVVVATCRSEDEARVRARLGWLFAELNTIEVPQFPITGPQAERVIHEFQRLALQRLQDWDGTLGSLVLGLTAKKQSYAELGLDRDPAARVLQAMKLLTLIGLEHHTERRLRAIGARVFFRAELDTDEVWRDAVDKLTRMQFVTESPLDGALIIRKDTYFEEVISDYPSTPQLLERDMVKLLAVFTDLSDVEGMFYVGNTFHSRKLYAQAQEAYESVLKLLTDDSVIRRVVVWRNLGNVLRTQRRNEEALAAYERALAIQPDYASAWRNKGSLFRNQRRYAEALAAYDRALEIEPDYAYAWNGKGKTLSDMGQPAAALAAYEHALELDPNFAYIWRNRGDALSQLGRFEAALVAYDRALGIDPGYAYAWTGKGNALRELGRLKEALAAFDHALAVDPQFVHALTGRAAALQGLHRTAEAEEAASRARAAEAGSGTETASEADADPREEDASADKE